MKPEIEALFAEEHIHETALLPLSACRVTLPRLLERNAPDAQSVILFLLPYYADTPENFSAYAAAEDYHFFVRELAERLIPKLCALFPAYRFSVFTDHSPIDERYAAVLSGLGVFGKNGLLLTEKYASFQFIAEILTDAPTELLGEVKTFDLRSCENCGACLAACPTGILRGAGEDCLSAITQKKGALTDAEKQLMRRYNTAWGCDVCQTVCPYTKRAKQNGSIVTPIPFFHQKRMSRLSSQVLNGMDDETFQRRAFAWRGKATVERNVAILEEKNK